MGIQYTPGASRLEVIQMFRLAAERSVPVFVHVRSAGRVEPGSSIEAVSEVIGAAAVSGASLHIVHINGRPERTKSTKFCPISVLASLLWKSDPKIAIFLHIHSFRIHS